MPATVPHTCPACGAGHSERRSARRGPERLLLWLLRRNRYACLDCGRQFWDRRTHTRGASRDASGDAALAPASQPPRPRGRRKPYPAAFRRYELYAAAGIVTALLMLLAYTLWVVWPEAPPAPLRGD